MKGVQGHKSCLGNRPDPLKLLDVRIALGAPYLKKTVRVEGVKGVSRRKGVLSIRNSASSGTDQPPPSMTGQL